MAVSQSNLRAAEIPIGTTIERLTTIGLPFRVGKGKKKQVVCDCVCGNVTAVAAHDLIRRGTKSCGCHRKTEIGGRTRTHGMSRTAIYHRWNAMKERCLNKNSSNYKDYGARGISVCPQWMKFDAFYKWAMESGFRPDLEIDRRENSGNYEPDNCRWIPRKANTRNRRSTVFVTAFGETKTLPDWADDPRCAVRRVILWERLFKQGWDPESAISTAPNASQKYRKGRGPKKRKLTP